MLSESDSKMRFINGAIKKKPENMKGNIRKTAIANIK